MERFRALSCLGLLIALDLACGDDDGVADADTATTTAATTAAATTATAGTTAATTGASASTAADTTTGDPGLPLTPVGHERELRGVWVASVFNINFPSAPGLSAEAQEAELLDLLDTMEAAGLNALFLQVRPECDALYPSELEPWSRSLSGAQGVDPGWDPLATAIDEAHLRGIELHAWLNPYRARASKGASLAPPHVALAYPEHAHDYGANTWMDPGAVPVQDHLLAVIDDLVARYDLDGIHFDDYFYPYPTDEDFPDDLTWQAYVKGGGELSRADWRRSNVDRMVKAVGERIAAARPDVRFGISPFGIYRPGIPAGITGFDQYEGLYADPLKWLDEGWVDYLAPQLYWPTTYPKQAYDVLVAWWASVTTGGRHIFAGNYLSKLGTAPEWSLDELRLQVELTRAQAGAGARGNIYFHIAPFQQDLQGVASAFASEFYAAPALTPPIAALADQPFAPPHLAQDGATVALAHPEPAALRAYVVYAADGDGWVLDRILPASTPSIDLPPGTWAISAAARSGVESLGAVVTAP